MVFQYLLACDRPLMRGAICIAASVVQSTVQQDNQDRCEHCGDHSELSAVCMVSEEHGYS